MRFTSLVIELIRARPRLVVWLVVLLQAALWLMLPLLLYGSPPGDLATVLAYGREYQVGTDLGPPLAFWLGDIAFRAAGNHMFGVYLLAQLCSVATFWTLFLLARSVVGGQQAVLAVLLTMTVAAFSSPGVEFGPLVLARPLWALLLLHSWQLIGQRRRNAWFAWSIEAGLLLLTAVNSGWFGRNPEEAPIIYRPPVDPLARDFVYFFAIAPALAGSLISGLFDLDRVAGGAGIALLMPGLAAIVAAGDLVQLRRQRVLRSVWVAVIIAPVLAVIATTLFLPWTGSGEVATSLPATAIARFFGDSFERRTNHPLPAVTGDAQLAALISLDAARPHLLLDAAPERTPWLTLAKFNETGGVVVWRASDTVGTPPADIVRRFPAWCRRCRGRSSGR